MGIIDKLTELFSQFPGIGPRQSKRFVYFLLSRNGGYIENFAALLKELKKEIIQCGNCLRFFPKDAKHSLLCPICRDEHRDKTTLLIVARDVDFENIEKSHIYDGLYFVLGGFVPILEKEPEKRIRSRELIKYLDKQIKSSTPLKEIILAMNANPDGESTADYIRQLISPLVIKNNIKISALGRGLSTGTELEYSDEDTIKNALKNRG